LPEFLFFFFFFLSVFVLFDVIFKNHFFSNNSSAEWLNAHAVIWLALTKTLARNAVVLSARRAVLPRFAVGVIRLLIVDELAQRFVVVEVVKVAKCRRKATPAGWMMTFLELTWTALVKSATVVEMVLILTVTELGARLVT
jgi:hypothetical protein